MCPTPFLPCRGLFSARNFETADTSPDFDTPLICVRPRTVVHDRFYWCKLGKLVIGHELHVRERLDADRPSRKGRNPKSETHIYLVRAVPSRYLSTETAVFPCGRDSVAGTSSTTQSDHNEEKGPQSRKLCPDHPTHEVDSDHQRQALVCTGRASRHSACGGWGEGRGRQPLGL